MSRVAIILSLIFVALFNRRDNILFLLDLVEIDEWFVNVLAKSLVDIGLDSSDYWTVDN
jgi:hypothetical protein